MISVEKCRELLPDSDPLSDEEVLKVCDQLYEVGQLAFESYLNSKNGSKNPERLLSRENGVVT